MKVLRFFTTDFKAQQLPQMNESHSLCKLLMNVGQKWYLWHTSKSAQYFIFLFTIIFGTENFDDVSKINNRHNNAEINDLKFKTLAIKYSHFSHSSLAQSNYIQGSVGSVINAMNIRRVLISTENMSRCKNIFE